MNKTVFSLSTLKFFLAASALVITGQVAFGQAAEIKKSKRLIDVDHVSEAMDPINQAIKQYPEEANLYYYLGYAQLKNNQLDAAAKSFDAGIALNAKEALNYAGKGHLSMLQNRPADAKTNLDKALEMTKSKRTPVLKAVAEAYLTNVKFAGDAVTLLQKAKTIDPRDAEIELLLADAQLMALQGQGGPSVSANENAAALDPKNGKPHYKIGLIYLRSRNVAAAQAAFEKAIAVDPGYTLAYKELGLLYYKQKEADKAIAAVEKYKSLSENSAESRLMEAYIQLMKKDYVKANVIFKEVLAKGNASATTYRYYGQSLVESGDTLGSKLIREEFFVKVKPEDIEAMDYVVYSKLLFTLKQDSLAVINLEKALQTDPKLVEAAQLQAESYLKKRKFAEATVAYKRLLAIKAKPSAQDYLGIARAYSGTSKHMEADTVYTKLLQQYPTNAALTFLAAGVKSNIDSTQEKGLAKPLYEKVLELTAATPDKYKKEILEANKYFGSYYLLVQLDIPKAKGYWEKVLAADPQNYQAQQALKAIKDGSIK